MSKPMTLEQRIKIEIMCKRGFNLNAIAHAIGVTWPTVKTDILRNGGRENYDAGKSHDAQIERLNKAQASRTITKQKKNPESYRQHKHRLENLEMQMEILTDQIKKLMNQQTEQQ